jgi:hypothetical protein
MSEAQLRIGDAEREQAAAALGDHVAQGRLSAEEYGERLDRVWAARTRGDLVPVFRDLPGHAPERRRTPQRGFWGGGPGPLLLVLAVLITLTVLTHVPLVLLGVLAAVFVTIRRRHRHPALGCR